MGKKVIYLPTCHSTNDIASQYAATVSTTEGCVIVTSHQTKGRGQRGNSWEAAPDQNLTFTIIVQPGFLQANQQFRLNIAVSLGVYDVLEHYVPQGTKIKWPNDLYINDRKVGGILIENILSGNQIRHSLIGIGINVNQTHFQESKAISLTMATGKEFNLPSLLEDLLVAIEQRYIQLRQHRYELLKAAYLPRLYWYQEEHTFQAVNSSNPDYFHGQIIGIDADGRLAVSSGEKINYYSFKEIIFIR